MPIPPAHEFLHNSGRASIHAQAAPGPCHVGRRRRSRRNLGARRGPRPSRPAPRLHGPHPGPRRTANAHSTPVAALGIRPGRRGGAGRRLKRRLDPRRASRSAAPPASEGSAFWIGREWLRATARRRGRRPARRLGRAPDAVSRIAALAPSVLRRARRGDRAARLIVATALHALAQLVRWTAHDLRLRPPVAVSWAGSLLGDARFRGGVWRAARRQGLGLQPVRPRHDATVAAARLAARLADRS